MLKITFFNNMPYIKDRTDWPYYHGDATYMELPDGQNMLVDISTKFSGAFITQRLLEMGVKRIDYFVATHLHQDHTAGFQELAGHIEVKNVLLSGYGVHNVDAESSMLETIEKKGIPVRQLRMGDEMQFGEVNLKFLFPPRDAPEGEQADQYGANLNLYSLVFKLSYGKFSALFTGDIHYETEEELVQIYGDELHSTLLKIPHHGNKTSTGQALVDAVNPQLAVVMSTDCEWVVLRRFSSLGIPLYGTFCDGTIVVGTDGTDMQVECDKGCRQFELR